MGFNDFMKSLKGDNSEKETKDAPQIIEKLTGKELVDIMKEEGYLVKLDEDDDAVWDLDGYKALVIRGAEGRNLVFRISFSTEVSFESINEWNSTQKYAVSYLRDNGVVLECHLDMDGGITPARLLDFFKTCRHQFHNWGKQVLSGDDDDEE